jgi:nucleoside-diphosphate-sugar epimerase
MRILLTGASGFTGRHFITQTQQAGHVIVTLHADLTDVATVNLAVQQAGQVDALVHLAAISFVGHADHAAFYAVNAVGTTHLLDALASQPAEQRPGKVLVASSANVYGNCEASPIRETQTPAPVNHYATSKLAMEHMALAYQDRLPVVVTRPFNYTGPGQASNFLIPKLVDHFARRAAVIELGNLHVEREFNDVRLVVESYLRLLEAGVPGQTYNVCTGRPYNLQTVLDTLIRITGYRMQVQVNPAFVRANEVHRLCGDPEKLLQCVGTLPEYSLEECLKRMLEHSTQSHEKQ